ncbi:transcriptional regulator [Burkholderia pseudomallei]|uniref:transcriptional regulator n=1 Tax=Burkholderia pseudomallei TaxID=28450 RepID=UPI000978278E|nr:Cro/CI family transcriptional regulator [Burkholderia pseudomallei]
MDTKTTSAIRRAGELVDGLSALARLLGVKPPTVQQWANGSRPVPAHQCVAIERLTHGSITRRELRNDWRDIWPELEQLEAKVQE